MGDLWVSYRWVLGGLWVGAVLLLLVGCGAKPTYWAALSPASPVVTAHALPADGATKYLVRCIMTNVFKIVKEWR